VNNKKSQPRKPKYTTRVRWRDALGRFANAPKKIKDLPTGLHKEKIKYLLTSRLTETEKISRKRVKERAQLSKKLTKGVKRVSAKEIPVNLERHLRYRTEKNKQWKKPGSKNFSKPRIGTKYQVAIFEGNDIIAYWRSAQYIKWDPYYKTLILKDSEIIRFPQSKRVSFELSGDTLRDAISNFSVTGLKYRSELHYEIRFSGVVTGAFGTKERIKFYHRGFINFEHMFGQSYDDYFAEQLTKTIDFMLKDTGRKGNQGAAYRFTSDEKLFEIADNPGWNEDADWQSIMEEKMLSEYLLTDVRGTFVGLIK
jgi:hypothetical protein